MQLFARVIELLFQQTRERFNHRIRQQDAKERADQRRTDHAAQYRGRLSDRTHRIHDAEHGGDNAERRQRARESRDRRHRLMPFVVVGIDLVVHQ